MDSFDAGVRTQWKKSLSRTKNTNIQVPLLVLSMFALLYMFIGENYILTVALVVAFVFIFFRNGIKVAICSYFFIGIWEAYTTLPFASGGAVICCFIASMLIIIEIKNKDFKVSLKGFIFLIVICVQGVMSFIMYREFSVFTMILDFFIALEIKKISMNETTEQRYEFWRNIFLFLFISSLLSVLWGAVTYILGDVATVYLNGLYIPRMKAVIGTDRACMLYCGAMIYPLFYVEKKSKKIAFCGIFIFCILMTLSVTAIFCTAVFFIVKLVHEFRTESRNKRFAVIVFLVVMLGWFFYVWNFGSHIMVVNTIVQRGHKILTLSNAGELESATSGRTGIWKEYMTVYHNSNILNKIFGTGVLNYYNTGQFIQYAHNSYIDMLLYMGLIPLIIFLIISINTCRMFKINHYYEYLPLLMVKVAYLVTAVSVSTFPAIYWWIWAIV